MIITKSLSKRTISSPIFGTKLQVYCSNLHGYNANEPIYVFPWIRYNQVCLYYYDVTGVTIFRVSLTGGVADRVGGLKRGDQLLSVNGVSVEGEHHEKAVELLKQVRQISPLLVFSGPKFVLSNKFWEVFQNNLAANFKGIWDRGWVWWLLAGIG